MPDSQTDPKPLVVVTGATGNIGSSLCDALENDYRIVGLDHHDEDGERDIIAFDISDAKSVDKAIRHIVEKHGRNIAAVVHLVAFFDFSGEPNPLYEKVNEQGTRNLLNALAQADVERFVYASTMLVHEPTDPGGRIDEDSPFDPRWAYPESKKKVEDIIRAEAMMPYAILRLAGVYDDERAVPTLSQQIARIYERSFQSHLYSGPLNAGQAMLNREDMVVAMRRTIEERATLPQDAAILIGEPYALGYDDLQDRIGTLIHGEKNWATIKVPAPLAKAGAWAQDKAEPIVPDAIDHGEKPFIQPFMIDMADDHYALDIKRAEDWLAWRPAHRLQDELPAMIANLKRDPLAWYERNGITPTDWLKDAGDACSGNAETLRREVEARRIDLHRQFRWPHLVNMLLAVWLMTQPPLIGIDNTLYAWSEIVLGAGLFVTAGLSLSWRLGWARWLSAGIGVVVMGLPIVFVTPNAAAYLSDTLVGAFIMGLAIAAPPEIGPTVVARVARPEVPPGWSFNPSAWTQRVPIIALALVGVLFSRYLAAYQMGQVDGVWEPFFNGSATDPQNGTEEIVTSSVSEAFPVPDAALGAYTYMLEIVTGVIGSRARWRTMPWLVLLFGLMIVPLGIVSIGFIIIQPIMIGTWSTLALIGGAAMLIQIPYSVDELAASLSFLKRRRKVGCSVLRVLFFGDTDEGRGMTEPRDEFARGPGAILRDMWTGGVNLPWTCWLAGLIGASFMFTRLTLGAEGILADVDHLMGALVLTVLAVAAAEVMRITRYFLVPLGLGIALAPFLFGGDTLHNAVSVIGGLAVAALAFPRGRITQDYGLLSKIIR
ncbi:NAD-dependent epimerase/dehydratase family protein [Croceicoccus hydrothermalis]|uniref:NAD-dependent epimerase/dehydratase family protein n=1 Tax=Croceicoccus hydrothermalis TaxID=2867964 RepID=UPI001EFB2DF3|nr:NAD-dependent epimerase/dehydratase family protein [Croceicoccus hydrothermalis]